MRAGRHASIMPTITGLDLRDRHDPGTPRRVIVAGAGLAGLTAALTLRDAGWDVAARGLVGSPGVRVLVGAERHDTVDLALRYLGLGAPEPVAADDQGRVAQEAKERCRDHLRAGRPFAFNATNTMRPTRKRWIDLFAGYGARVEIVYVEPPTPEIMARNARRSNPVPRRVIERLAARLEPPTWAEAHRVEMVG